MLSQLKNMKMYGNIIKVQANLNSMPISGWNWFLAFFHENYNEANFGFVAHVLHLNYSFMYSKIRGKQGMVDLIDKC